MQSLNSVSQHTYRRRIYTLCFLAIRSTSYSPKAALLWQAETLCPQALKRPKRRLENGEGIANKSNH